ncbi:glycosyltransferase [Lacisediminihabitans profunda]|uniref:D-inositol 3-phosphate glycosyltransferase n=1 Tax=Lacisediminihabitans profunda TaxID=2594790 RepID=A0A5C8UZ26_9MICO|nr:glycosyltransferase [Lacisediminihabitans profunda]TXN32888.1 glycosyltransferase family 4 protein [Lacisediminihabitans profunda]
MLTDLSDSPPDTFSAAKAPLRVLIGADTFPPDVNGAANFASRLAAGLVDRGHDVFVEAPAASRKHGTFVEEHDGARFTVYRVYSWRWYPHDWLRFVLPWRSQAHAARILDEVKPDVVHIQSHIVVGRGLARQAVKRGIRVVGTNHFMPENMIDHTKLPHFLRKPVIRAAWADAASTFGLCESVTSPSRKAADFLEAETNLVGVHAISCGIDAALYTPSFEKRTGNTIVFVGRVSGEKHIDVLLRAVAAIDPSLDAKLEIVGGGDQMNQLKQMAKDLGIADRVNFTGYVTDEELRAALTRATVFAMPSIAELQSIATMEAMASALPIVAADAMALPHLVHEGRNGHLFTPGDSADLAAKLTDVLTLPDDELMAMKKASLNYIAAHDIQRTLSIFESLYRGETVTDPVTDASLDEQVP